MPVPDSKWTLLLLFFDFKKDWTVQEFWLTLMTWFLSLLEEDQRASLPQNSQLLAVNPIFRPIRMRRRIPRKQVSLTWTVKICIGCKVLMWWHSSKVAIGSESEIEVGEDAETTVTLPEVKRTVILGLTKKKKSKKSQKQAIVYRWRSMRNSIIND